MVKVSQNVKKVKQNFSPENAAAFEKRGLTPEQVEEMGLLDAESETARHGLSRVFLQSRSLARKLSYLLSSGH